MLFRATNAGWRLYLIGNEESVARGKLSDAAWEKLETQLCAHLRGQGIALARHYASVDLPDGKPPHQKDSVFAFPNTGAMYHAVQNDGIDLAESWVISNDLHELVAGWRAGRAHVRDRLGPRAAREQAADRARSTLRELGASTAAARKRAAELSLSRARSMSKNRSLCRRDAFGGAPITVLTGR